MTERLSLVAEVVVNSDADRLLESTLPLVSSHAEGGLERAQRLLAGNPSAATESIWVASATGELDAARELLAASPELADQRGGTRDWEPLLYLCFSRFLRLDPERAAAMERIASLLLDHGADPDVRWIDPLFNDSQETPLYGAAGIANRPALARLLIEAGADPNDGETPYHMVEHDGVPCAEVIFPKLDESSRGTALVHKLDYPDLVGLRKLLELGADPNGPNPFENKALHQAVFRGHSREFFDLLLAHGADVDATNGDGFTPYTLAARSGRADIMAWLAAAGASPHMQPVDELVAACALGDRDGAAGVLDRHPDVRDRLTAADRAAICEAADAGNTEGVRSMLDHGWDVNARGTVWAETPTHRAAMQGRVETVQLLLERGADLTIRDRSYESSPLGWARHGNQPAVLELLQADPARLDLRDAVECGFAERALELIGDTDPDAAILGGDAGVLLRAAAWSGNTELVHELLRRGANPGLLNREGQSAADAARRSGHDDLAAELEALSES